MRCGYKYKSGVRMLGRSVHPPHRRGRGGGSKLGLSAFGIEPVHLQSKNHRKKYEKNDLHFDKNG